MRLKAMFLEWKRRWGMKGNKFEVFAYLSTAANLRTGFCIGKDANMADELFGIDSTKKFQSIVASLEALGVIKREECNSPFDRTGKKKLSGIRILDPEEWPPFGEIPQEIHEVSEVAPQEPNTDEPLDIGWVNGLSNAKVPQKYHREIIDRAEKKGLNPGNVISMCEKAAAAGGFISDEEAAMTIRGLA